MQGDKMTHAVQEALAEAQQVAMTRKHQFIEIPHLWKVLIQPNELATNIYSDLGLAIDQFETTIDKELDKISQVSGATVQYGQQFGQGLYQLLTEANRIMTDFQDEYLSTDVLLLALMTFSNHPLVVHLNQYNINQERLKEKIAEIRGGDRD